ncbi:putative mitochondrial ribosomal protein subunit [Elsinoe fawcettii]|nr:putative mitochondrial ribosomal protein subunit [Elsinoe fawcettii]
MSKALSSPTARILRSSRFFSMPPPLPQPSIDLPTTSGNIKTSDTATLPYPTRQAITAPASSRHRGDWGLKRPLPEKTNSTSTPHVRINAMDTLEHITDFDTASDHTLTLRKAQEMNLWMTQASKKRSNSYNNPPLSAFDEIVDHTALRDPSSSVENANINQLPLGVERTLRIRKINHILQQRGEKAERWKTEGPWLPTMSEIDFEKYLVDVVSKPRIREEFKKFLIKIRSDKKRLQAMEQLREESGFNPENPEDVARLDGMSSITQEDLETDRYLLELRQNNTDLSSELPGLIQEFFDLPPIPKAPGATHQISVLADRLKNNKTSDAPPAAHPSAGLTYIRTRSYMENSPVHGPQYQHTPLQARVLRPRTAPQGASEQAMIGVGGFAAKDKTKQGHVPRDEESNERKGMDWNFNVPGGNKLWVTPSEGRIDDNGRVRVATEYPDREALAVKMGGPDPRNVQLDDGNDSIREQLRNTRVATEDEQRNTAPPGTAKNANYGSALPDTRTAPRAKGLDREDLKMFEDAVRRGKNDRNVELGRSILDILDKSKARSS